MACKHIYKGITYNSKEEFISKIINPQFLSNQKVRRVMELQSDLFQKGRDKEDLINRNDYGNIPIERKDYKLLNGDWLVPYGRYDNFVRISKMDYERNYREGEIVYGKYVPELLTQNNINFKNKSPQNQFLQLLNKDNNWVTFFVKSIIQDSSKKGYEKVLFPSGNTASKVEGHTTLEEFKKQKEDRITTVNKEYENFEKVVNTLNYDSRRYKDIFFKFDKKEDLYIVEDVKVTKKEYLNKFKQLNEIEINQLKQELQRVETEGFGALKPIYNFYENTVTNILKKQGFNPVLITDEYGNTWNEIDLSNPKVKEQTDLIKFQAPDLEYKGDLAIEEKLAEMFENTADEDLPKTLIGQWMLAVRNFFRNIFKERSEITRFFRDINQGKIIKTTPKVYSASGEESTLYPKTVYQLPQDREIEEFVASEKTIRDLAARMSDRIGIPITFESDRTQEYKGKLENGIAYINLAYATLDTVPHEILGHPIIRAIKNNYKFTEFEPDEDTPFGGTLKQEEGYSQLYQNLLKELETGKGKEVLDRIKRDYKYKYNIEKTDSDYGNYKIKVSESGAKYFDTFEEAQKALETYAGIKYTLEEQQEEAIVELLGLMTSEKLDKVKDGKLISLLKRLLKEMKQFIRSLLTQKEVEVDKLPDNMTLGDLSNLLAYSNSKLILPGNEVIYTTPDNKTFKTYTEASSHISNLAKNVKDIDLNSININVILSEKDLKEIERLEKQKQEKENYFISTEYQQDKKDKLQSLNKKLEALKNKKVEFYSQEPYLDKEDIDKYGFQDYSYVRVESSYSRIKLIDKPLWEQEFGSDFRGYYIHGYNTDKTKPNRKVLKITKEEAERIWKKEALKFPDLALNVNDQQDIYRLQDEIKSVESDSKIKYEIDFIEKNIKVIKNGGNTIQNFIEKNKEYEQSKEIIEEWKKVNNIQYDPEEIYSRGQEFVSVLGAYSSFDVNLMMQNLLSHIEDNEKAGGQFAISAFTKPINKQIGHLEGGGGKIKFKIYPRSEDILWASNIDVYSGSVWDASEKINKDKKSELLGVSYSKYPSLSNVTAVQPNLADIIDKLSHHHNELGIVLTSNNFRLEYDSDIPYQTKKIIDGINSILDQKYGKLVKPEISRKVTGITKYKVVDTEPDTAIGQTEWLFDKEEEAKDFKATKGYGYDIVKFKEYGIQPTQTNKTIKKSIDSVKSKVVKYNEGSLTDKSEFTEVSEKEYSEAVQKGKKGFDLGTSSFGYAETYDYNGYIYTQIDYNKETGVDTYGKIKKESKEYTSQALINTKIAVLKEVAKKYPRSLIRSEVKSIVSEDWFDSGDITFQKITPKVYSASGEESTLYPKIVDYIKENGFNPNEPYYKDYLKAGYIKDFTPEELAIVHYNLAYPNENIEPAQLFETLTKPEKQVLENYEIDPSAISTAEAKLIVYNPNEAIRQTMTYFKTMRGNNTEKFYYEVRDKQDKLYKDYGCM